MSQDTKTVQGPNLLIGKSVYKVTHEYRINSYSGEEVVETFLTGPRGALYILQPMEVFTKEGTILDTGYRKAQALMSDSMIRRRGNVAKFFQVGNVLEYVGVFE